jgi:hypothetical protein
MTKKKQETKPTMKTWIWLKGPKSKAMAEMRDEFGIDKVNGLCGQWLEVERTDGDGDHHLPDGETMVFPKEVAHIRESIECPKDPPAKVVRTKVHKVKDTKKHVWTTRTLEIKDSVHKTTLRALILESVDEINQLGTENAKLKNQIAGLKKKGTK